MADGAEGDGMRLMLGDCLDRMKEIEDGSVDLVLTDPPYRVISGGGEGNKSLSNSLGGNNGKIFTHNDINFSEWLPVVFLKLKENAHIYVMTNFMNLQAAMAEMQAAGFKLHNLLVWEKQNLTPSRWYMKNCEYTIFGRKGAAFPIFNPSSATVHKHHNPVGKKLHPTEKPVSLMEMYVSNSAKVGGVVLDPFMGSGTTGVACVNTNRKFIGIERDESYFQIAKGRIEKAQEDKRGMLF